MPLELEPDHLALVTLNGGQLDRLDGNGGARQAKGDTSRRNASLAQLGLQCRSGLFGVNDKRLRPPPLDQRCHQAVAVKKKPQSDRR
ncbi:MAG TPA: hypothetical protein VID04_14715 [Methylomirabilota bacterium]|jgi:hypothetical protein